MTDDTTIEPEAADEAALQAHLDLLVQANEAIKDSIAEGDAFAIWKACHGGWTGLGTDEKTLCGIMGHRTKGQLERIDEARHARRPSAKAKKVGKRRATDLGWADEYQLPDD